MDYEVVHHPLWPYEKENTDYIVTVEWRPENGTVIKAKEIEIPGFTFIGIDVRLGYCVFRYKFKFENTDGLEDNELETAIESEIINMLYAAESVVHPDHFANDKNSFDYEPV